MTQPQTVLAVAVCALAVLAIGRFEWLCLHELSGTPDADLRYLTHAGWQLAIICAIPLGGVAYLYLGRSR